MPEFYDILGFKNGWIMGNFEPSILKTPEFEVCVIEHAAGEVSVPHYHTSSTEYNVVLKGRLEVNGQILTKGQIFVYYTNEVSNVRFIENSELLVIRVPSAPHDKVFVGES